LSETLRSIVLRRRDAGESDRQLTLLTEERGLVEVVAKGARKAGSRLAGASEPLSVSIFHVAAGKRRQFVTQAQPITSFPAIRSDYDRLAAALVLAEIAAETTPHERPEEALFGFTVAALRFIEVHEQPLVALVWAGVRMLEITGHLPSFVRCAETGVKIREAEPFVVPAAGGYVVAERAVTMAGRFQTKAEFLVGLAKLAELDLPPDRFKQVHASLRLLEVFWQDIAGGRLRALRSLLEGAESSNEMRA